MVRYQQIICAICGKYTDNDGGADKRGWRYSFFHRELTTCPECEYQKYLAENKLKPNNELLEGKNEQ